MAKPLDIGDKVKYLNPKTGKKEIGTIFGIRKVEHKHKDIVLSYVVDTGNDARVDVYKIDQRGEEISQLLNEAKLSDPQLANNSEAFFGALNKISNSKDLPEPGIIEEKVRQPEQVDVRPRDIEPA